PWRYPVVMLAAALAWAAVMIWAGAEYQSARYLQVRGVVTDDVNVKIEEARNTASFETGSEAGQQKSINAAEKTAIFVSFGGPVLAPFLFAFAFGGAGYALAKMRDRRKWESIELLLQGRLFSRPVAAPIAAGALCGVAIAAARYVAAILFRG